jgi:predicted DsbA family dithiol-disulfide isomerase
LANSFNAHRLLHLAKEHKLGNELKEQLLKAYLTDGKDVNDLETLIALGQAVGLEKTTVEEVLHSDTFSNEVKKDIATAQKIGVQGVPFFVFDDKYAISGAQIEDVFLETLQKTWEEGSFVPQVKLVNTTNRDNCGVDGCE